MLRLVDVVPVLAVAVAVAPQHELFQQEEGEEPDEHRQHHALGAAFLQRVRQEFEEHRAEQRADRERDQPRHPRRAQRQRERRGDHREHAPRSAAAIVQASVGGIVGAASRGGRLAPRRMKPAVAL